MSHHVPSRNVEGFLRAIEAGEVNPAASVIPSRPDITLYTLLAVGDREAWHAARIARALRIGRATLWRCLTRLGLSLRGEKQWGYYRKRYALRLIVRGGARIDETQWHSHETTRNGDERS